MIQNFLLEILYQVSTVRFACVDQGDTARSLALTSKYVSTVSSRFPFHTLYLASADIFQHSLRRLSSLPPHLRPVMPPFIAD